MSSEILRSIEVSLTKQDLLDFWTFAKLKQVPRLRLLQILSTFVTGISLILMGTLAILNPTGFDSSDALLMGIGVSCMAYLWWYPALLRASSRRRINLPGFEKQFLPQRLSLTNDGINYSGPMGTGLTHWDAIGDVRSTDSAVYAFITPDEAYIFPRHVFADSIAFQDFVSIIKAHQGEPSAAPKDRTAIRLVIGTAVGLLLVGLVKSALSFRMM